MRKGDKGFINGLIPTTLLVSNRTLPRKVMFVSGIYLRNVILPGKATNGRIWPLLKIGSKA